MTFTGTSPVFFAFTTIFSLVSQHGSDWHPSYPSGGLIDLMESSISEQLWCSLCACRLGYYVDTSD